MDKSRNSKNSPECDIYLVMLGNIILAKTDTNSDVIIVVSNWTFLAMGEGHIILQNSC